MIRRAMVFYPALVVCLLISFASAQSTQQGSAGKIKAGLRNYVERRNKASQRWKELALLLKDSPSQVKVQPFIDKEIMFDALLVGREAHLLMLRAENGVNIKVNLTQSIKLPVADSIVLRVLGKVEEISRKDLVLTVKANEVRVAAAE